MSSTRVAPAPMHYPTELPISARRDELLACIAANQVVIVAGETGSGKSTQLPKLCLELGRGVGGLIGHTQPRRIAARSIAERLAEELGETVGGRVGYTVRFTDQVGPETMVKVMTDGILLAEIRRDRELSRYDTIIIDEAHERSLNIDFLLGYLHGLLARRPELKLIITSATIDTERFAHHFDDAPVIEVSGRSHPVEIRYRPLDDDDGGTTGGDGSGSRDQPQAIGDAVQELVAEGPGDILVFCSGEREIRDAAEALEDLGLANTEIVALYARLSAAEQHRVFQPHRGRRIVLATNVAETSLTVPGIRSVIDTGLVRMSRYNRRTKVQRLPIEPISRASANQRAGRCGRLGPGICIRLYSEEDFAARPAFTDPEIQRTNLASVILQMAAIGLGRVEDFPFLDPPDTRTIRDGIALLEELGAIRPDRVGTRDWLTPLGRRLATIPLDPRLGRMMLAAADGGCLNEVMIIVAGLSILDPRERPRDRQPEAAAAHARFRDPSGDFVSYLHLWEYLATERRARSANQFRRMCRAEFLHYLRVREWSDLLSQLRRVARDLKLSVNHEPAPPEAIHRALLAGLLSQVAMRDQATTRGAEFRGARQSRLMIAPGSVLAKAPPRWIMAAELVETNRLWARTVARIEPSWLESVGAHLVKRTYTEPWWDRDRGTVTSEETVSLYGLVLASRRRLNWARVDPVDARARFLLHALVRNEWDANHAFVAENADRLAEVRELEAIHRRGDLVIDEAGRLAFFDARVPAEITSRSQFDKWWRRAQRRTPDRLSFTRRDLLRPEAADLDDSGFPDTWRQGAVSLAVSYVLSPGDPDDGTVIDLPVKSLGSVNADTLAWNVPGVRAELVAALLRTLPRTLRRELVPIPATAATLLDAVDPEAGAPVAELCRVLRRGRGLEVTADDFDWTRVPTHLRPWYRVHDDDFVVVAEGSSLAAIAALLDERVREALGRAPHRLERDDVTAWDFGDLPPVVVTEELGHRVDAFPALVTEDDRIAVRVLTDPDEQAERMWEGTRALLRRRLPAPQRALDRLLTNRAKLALAVGPHGSFPAWADDVANAAVDQLLLAAGGPVWDATAFARLEATVRSGFGPALAAVAADAAAVAVRVTEVARARSEMVPGAALSRADIDHQVAGLVYPGHLTGVGAERLADLDRYLAAIVVRLDRLREDVRRDEALVARIQVLEQAVEQAGARCGWSPAWEALRWDLQELRVSLFAQRIGAARPVSEKRIRTALAQLVA